MTQLGESIAITTITDPDKPHWVQVQYTYANGKPVKGRFLATDSSGMTWVGILNDQGVACLSNLPAGPVEFELLSEDVEDELKHTRENIKAVLDAMVVEQKIEAAKYEQELAQMGRLEKAGYYSWALARGFWDGAVGLVGFVKDVVVTAAEIAEYLKPLHQLNNILHATYKSYQAGDFNSDAWKKSVVQNLKNEHIKDVAHILGVDANKLSPEELQKLKALFAEAYEITAFIADDQESHTMLLQFAKDYAGAQSSVEWAEFAGGGIFEIVLAALLATFTGGVGNVAQAGSKIKHAGKLKSLGSIFRRLGNLLKRKKLRRKLSKVVDRKHKLKTKTPPDKKLKTLKTPHQKAAFGEKTAHDKMVKDGHTPLGKTDGVYKPGQTGIDGVYKNANPPPDYIITEAKYNAAKLGDTVDGKQMSDEWVMGSNRLGKAGLSKADQQAIERGLSRGDGSVEKRLIRVMPDGSSTTTLIK